MPMLSIDWLFHCQLIVNIVHIDREYSTIDIENNLKEYLIYHTFAIISDRSNLTLGPNIGSNLTI